MATEKTNIDLDEIDIDPDEPAAELLRQKKEKEKQEAMAQAQEADKTKDSKTPEPEEDDDFSGYFERPHVISRFYYGENNEAQLTEFDGAEKCGGSVFIEGLAGVGISSTVVSAYLVGTLKLPLVAVFFSPQMPGMCSIHGYLPASPIRIYGNEDVCVAVGDYEIQPSQQSKLVYSMTQAFLDFARRHKCRQIVSIDGYPVKGDMGKKIEKIAKMLPSEKNKLSFGDSGSGSDDGDEDADDNKATSNGSDAKNGNDSNGLNTDSNGKKKKKKRGVFETVGYLTNSPDIGKKLQEAGHKPIKTGQIIGVTGAMLTLSFTNPNDDPPLTVILAPDPVQIPDQRGALLAVSILKEHFDLPTIDSTELKTEADRLASKIQTTIEQIKQQVSRQYAPRQMRPPPGMYT